MQESSSKQQTAAIPPHTTGRHPAETGHAATQGGVHHSHPRHAEHGRGEHGRAEHGWRLPTVDEAEVTALACRYGMPRRRHITLPADEYTRPYRFGRKGDRRAEVVFAIEDPAGGVWVHAKAHYPRHIFRLPSGGIHWQEGVEAALMREIHEETALPVVVSRFLGLYEYIFLHEGQQAFFASYIFSLRSAGGQPVPHEGEAITNFQLVPTGQLTELAADMRNLGGDRRGWGQWRALAHDLAHEALQDAGQSIHGMRSHPAPRPAAL
jgi:ADP-ribose pyrophosphatase YjhB (NUDIX family)